MIKPGRFINEARLTGWFSVPSTAMFIGGSGSSSPHLRLSLFCGEALPLEVVRDWSTAAPNSRIEYIYGPTELTIGCTAYRWDNVTSPPYCEHGIVPIGEPFEDMEALIVDEELREVEAGGEGELIMTGPQLSQGYWRDEEKPRRAFVSLPGRQSVYYRTGHCVYRAAPDKPIAYLGRADNQIKVLGHRVELGEVESVVRSISGADAVVAIGWPSASNAEAIELLLSGQLRQSDSSRNSRRSSQPTCYHERFGCLSNCR
jgi:non-ribosomal peptide synthetase component F